MHEALRRGYLRDLDDRRTRSNLATGDQLPEDEELLPRADGSWCRGLLVGARGTEGVTPPSPQDTVEQMREAGLDPIEKEGR